AIAQPVVVEAAPETVDSLVDRFVAVAARGGDEEARDLAERLHQMGTAEAIARIRSKPGHASAVALMRDARWNVPGAGDVPLFSDLFSDPEAGRAVLALIRLRLSSVRAQIARRWAGAAAAGAIGGAAAGILGGVVLYLAPMSQAQLQSSLALGALGAL